MPAKLSKFSIEASCYECWHPWTKSCMNNAAENLLESLEQSFKIYATLYSLSLLLKRRIPTKRDLKNTIIGTAQSTAFLSWSTCSYSMFICILRRLLGKFNILTVSFIPAFFSSLSAILIETPSRRPMLCLYVANVATETLFRMAESRGYVSPIQKGEVFIFAAGMTTLLYMYRSQKIQDSIFKLASSVLGPFEGYGYEQKHHEIQTRNSINSEEKNDCDRRKKPSNSIISVVFKALEMYKLVIDKIKTAGGKDPSCPHPNSCLYYVVSSGLKLFSLGFAAQVGLKLLFQVKILMTKPGKFKSMLFKKETFNLACFLGGFVSLYKLVSCSLRRAYNEDSPNFAIPASLIASATFVIYPDNTIALYIAWKAAQLLWNNGVESGKLPKVKWFEIFLYSFSTAVLFHAAIVEPHNLRLSYWKFLYNFTGGKLAVVSSRTMDKFGLKTNKQLQEIFQKSCLKNMHVFGILKKTNI